MPYGSKPREAPRSAGEVRYLEVDSGDAGQRLDNWLIKRLGRVPRPLVYKLLRTGQVRVNGKRAKPLNRVAAGDRVRLPPVSLAAPEREGPARVPQGLKDLVERSIVHEDPALLVLAKPAGLAVHGGSGESFGVIEALRAARPEEELELAHRLDRDTSGLLLVARERASLRALHALMRENAVEKRYLALVRGQWNLGKTRVDAPLATDARRGGERHVRVAGAGKASSSTFEPVDFFGARATLLEVAIHTGRTHQIRVHAAHAGHPVAGDAKYGDREFNEEMRGLGLDRMFLHAHSLSFTWPGGGREFSASAPLPEELKRVLEALGALRRRRRR
jgi:23S rRNA pseudouridine955/2504/2580 synthase